MKYTPISTTLHQKQRGRNQLIRFPIYEYRHVFFLTPAFRRFLGGCQFSFWFSHYLNDLLSVHYTELKPGDKFAEVSKSTRDELIDQIDKMEPEKVQKVLDFARTLSGTAKGVRGDQLLQFSGKIDPQDLQAISEAIEQECEKINAKCW